MLADVATKTATAMRRCQVTRKSLLIADLLQSGSEAGGFRTRLFNAGCRGSGKLKKNSNSIVTRHICSRARYMFLWCAVEGTLRAAGTLASPRLASCHPRRCRVCTARCQRPPPPAPCTPTRLCRLATASRHRTAGGGSLLARHFVGQAAPTMSPGGIGPRWHLSQAPMVSRLSAAATGIGAWLTAGGHRRGAGGADRLPLRSGPSGRGVRRLPRGGSSGRRWG